MTVLQSNPIKGDKFILGFLEIVSINETLYNGNIGENNHFIVDFFEIVPFNGVPFNEVRVDCTVRLYVHSVVKTGK